MAYTETEQRILDMWPRYEDGKPVWFGDQYEDWNGMNAEVAAVELEPSRFNLLDHEDYPTCFGIGEHVKHPAPKVLDADGVEIKVGDRVYEPRMFGDNSFTVSRFTKNRDGKTFVMVEEMGGGLFPETVTHARPDSRERVVGLLDKGVVARIDKLVEEGRWLND